MKKTISCITLCMLLLSAMTTFSFAEEMSTTNKYGASEITEMEEISDAIKNLADDEGLLTKTEQVEILENSSSEAVEAFYDAAIQETQQKIEDDEFYLTTQGVISETYELECGEIVTVTYEDCETSFASSIKGLLVDEVYAAMVQPKNVYKDYGTYTFTATYEFAVLGTLIFKEKVKYKINDNGLTLISHSASSSAGSLTIRYHDKKSVANVKTAKTAGKYIQATGTFYYYWEIEGIRSETTYDKVRARVTLKELDKSKDRAYIRLEGLLA